MINRRQYIEPTRWTALFSIPREAMSEDFTHYFISTASNVAWSGLIQEIGRLSPQIWVLTIDEKSAII